MIKENINTDKLFKTQTALSVLPETLTVWHDLKLKDATIDIIINGYNTPELSNAVAENYLLLEEDLPINIIIVESSGNKQVYDKLIQDNRVSKILLKDHKAKHPEKGAGSYGMAISSEIGFYFSQSEYVFFSHNDVIALKKDFLSFLLSKMNETTRIASFHQRHVIPFTGCMLIKRDVMEKSETDWLLYDENPYIKKSVFLQNLCELREQGKYKLQCNWIDAGESLIYNEIATGKKIYTGASFGGTKGLWKTSFDIAEVKREDIEALSPENPPIIYGKIKISKKEFLKKYKFVIRAGKKWESIKWVLNKKKNYWRYCFDDSNDLIFIHHGRGTRRSVNRWLKFVKKLNDKLRKPDLNFF